MDLINNETELSNAILNFLKNNFIESNGSNGTTAIQIMNHTGEDFETCKNALNSLHKSKEIRSRKGINGFLYFWIKKD